MDSYVNVKPVLNHLKPLEEKFVHLYLETGYAVRAYRGAFGDGNFSYGALKSRACSFLASPKIQEAIMLARNNERVRHVNTIDEILEDLEEIQDQALEARKFDAAITAAMGRAKILGLLVDKAEVTGKNGGAIELANVSGEEVARRLAFIFAQEAHKTIDVTPTTTDEAQDNDQDDQDEVEFLLS